MMMRLPQLMEIRGLPARFTHEENIAELISSLSEEVPLEWVQHLAIVKFHVATTTKATSNAWNAWRSQIPCEWGPQCSDSPHTYRPAPGARRVAPSASAVLFVQGHWLYAFSGARSLKVRWKAEGTVS